MCGIILGSITLPQKFRNEIKKITVLECKKNVSFLRKLTKMSKLILCFSEIPKTVVSVRVRQVIFFYLRTEKKLSVQSSVLFTVSALEIREMETYKKKTYSNVSALLNKISALEHDRLMLVSQ